MDAGDEDEEMDLPLISTHLYGFILLGCMRAVGSYRTVEKTEFRFGEMRGFIFSSQIRASRRDARWRLICALYTAI